jgi:penicillin-binding protein 1A
LLAFVLRGLFVVFVAVATLVLVWTTRYSFAVHRLARGVGNTVFYGADGRPWFALDESRRDVSLSEISPHLRRAVIAVEDRRFYRHPGLDPIGMGRAALRNLRRGTVVEGGSTLTQQLARTLFLGNQRTLGRKVKEAMLAVMIEDQLRKDQILELYLNRIYLSAGTYGVETMSRRLFAKRARDVTLAEAAVIAGLIRAPSALSPWSNLDGALARSDVVLSRMRAAGLVTPEEERQARTARLRITSSPGLANARSGYAKEFLRQLYRDEVGGDDAPDWEVHTTFLPAIQQAAEQAVARGLERLGRPGLQAALVALDPETGDILGLVGGRDFTASSFNRAVRSRRQPGSAFKPFVYAAALERGMSPVTVLANLNAVVAPGRDEWTPRNAEDAPEEATLRQALLESNNQAAVALELKLGTNQVLRVADAVGLHDQPNVASLALGTGLVTPLELTAAYAAFPNGGLAVVPRGIVRVLDGEGSVVHETPTRTHRALSEAAAFQALTMLRDVVDMGTGATARSLGVRGAVGGKTGTTSEFKDAWFVGFTSSVVAGVWVGFDQPEPIGSEAYGARVALPIWADFMRRAARVRPGDEFSVPPGLREVELCRVSYLRPVAGCPTYIEYFKDGDDVPHRLCPLHEGTFKQEARRAIDGVLAKVGRRIFEIFH